MSLRLRGSTTGLPDLARGSCQTLTPASRAAASLRSAPVLALRSLTLATTLDSDSGPGRRSDKEAIQEYRFPAEAHSARLGRRDPGQACSGRWSLVAGRLGRGRPLLAMWPRTLRRYSFSRKAVTARSKAAG